MYCRKDFLDLTPLERNRLGDAFNELWDANRFQIYGPLHEDAWFSIHRGPEFLPWHRWFVLRLEHELQSIDARVSVPYWDWARADARDLDAEPWKSFFGGRDNTGGHFDHWTYERDSASGSLPNYDDLIDELDVPTYADFRVMEAGSHVPGHTWTGGTMSSRASPGDPLFFLHHCNVDRLWAIWQMNNSGAAQYTQTAASTDNDAFTGSKDGIDDPMFAGALGGAATPAAMLDHRALGYRYPTDSALASQWQISNGSTLITGDPIEIDLLTPAVAFVDVPEGETTMRAIHFTVESCERLLFEVIGPTGPFALDDSGPFWFPQGDIPTSDQRIWIVHTAPAAGLNSNGEVTVRATNAVTGELVQEWPSIAISANSIMLPTAAIALVLDESGSMLADAGNNRDTRLEVLQTAAMTLVDQLFDDNGLMVVSFDETATRLTDLAEAGSLTSGVRNAARTAILNHGPPDESPHTSIGAGLQRAAEGYSESPLTPSFTVQATVVFTDGIEDREPWIRDVESQVPERVYAVGVANAANVDSNKLREIADNSGGFMLVQGAVTEDDEFMLEKFFLQILAGVLNRDIVTDPPGVAVPGEISRVPFPINRSDVQFDAVALTRFVPGLVLGLETPDETIIGPSQMPAGITRTGASSKSLRVTLPLVIDGKEYWDGDWNLLLSSNGKSGLPTHGVAAFSQTAAIPYYAVVHARSSLNLRASLSQTALTPGSDMMLEATLTEYGQPLPTHPTVYAELLPPNGVTVIVGLIETSVGVFNANVLAEQSGVYRFRVIAHGLSRRSRPFRREHLLTGVVGHPSRNPDGTPPATTRPDPEICKLLGCLLSDKVLTDKFRKYLEGLGIDLEQLRRCVGDWCSPDRKSGRTPNDALDILRTPQMARALRRFLDDQ